MIEQTLTIDNRKISGIGGKYYFKFHYDDRQAEISIINENDILLINLETHQVLALRNYLNTYFPNTCFHHWEYVESWNTYQRKKCTKCKKLKIEKL